MEQKDAQIVSLNGINADKDPRTPEKKEALDRWRGKTEGAEILQYPHRIDESGATVSADAFYSEPLSSEKT